MNPEQALAILDEACGHAPLNRAAHLKIHQAVQVLKKAIRPEPEPADEEAKEE